MTEIAKIEEAKKYVLSQVKDFPKFLIVLGSGLASVLEQLKVEVDIPYEKIPHLKAPTVIGHKGKLLIGMLGKTRVACMQGRLHYYEGLQMSEVVFPFRVFCKAGAEVVLLSNAAGGLSTAFKPTDLVLIQDHINMMGNNPLIGPNVPELGARFPDMSHLYDPKINQAFLKVAKKQKVNLKKGIYVGIHGPSYETPAEIRLYKKMGASVVGMSTIPEAIAIHHMGKRVACISCVTNYAAGVIKQQLDHSEVLDNAKKVQAKFSKLVIETLDQLRSEYV